MAIDRTSEQLQAIVDRLQAYLTPRGDSLGTICAGRIYFRQAPDDASFTEPYIFMMKMNAETDPDVGNLREEFDLELMCVGGDPDQLELIADLARAALLTYRVSSAADGLMHTMWATRDTVPVEKEPPNRNVLQIKVTAHMSAWSRPLFDALT